MGYVDRRSSRRKNDGCCGCGCFSGCFGCLLVIGLIAAGLMLAVYWWSTSAPKPLRPNYTPSVNEANSFENKIQQASSGAARTGVFNLLVTEGEASSWLNLRAEAVTNSTLPLDNLQVMFRNNRAQLYGELDAGFTQVGMLIGFELTIDQRGQLQVNIDSIDAGGVSVPDAVRDEINTQIRSVVEEEIRKLGNTPDYTIRSLRVSDGQLSIQGTKP
ncbi:MAG: hypothetical protein KJ064_02470 [Anaerolineae bacterium]|nr:hypothetical protein [Anaerolineae bacterium]